MDEISQWIFLRRETSFHRSASLVSNGYLLRFNFSVFLLSEKILKTFLSQASESLFPVNKSSHSHFKQHPALYTVNRNWSGKGIFCLAWYQHCVEFLSERTPIKPCQFLVRWFRCWLSPNWKEKSLILSNFMSWGFSPSDHRFSVFESERLIFELRLSREWKCFFWSRFEAENVLNSLFLSRYFQQSCFTQTGQNKLKPLSTDFLKR